MNFTKSDFEEVLDQVWDLVYDQNSMLCNGRVSNQAWSQVWPIRRHVDNQVGIQICDDIIPDLVDVA